MTILKSLFLSCIVTCSISPLFGTETPQPTRPDTDPFLYAAVHALSNYTYRISTALTQEMLFETLLSSTYQRMGGPSRIKDVALYTLGYTMRLITLYGSYRLPDIVDQVVFGKTRQRSSMHKLLSLGNRSYFGARGAFVESFLEMEADKRRQEKIGEPQHA